MEIYNLNAYISKEKKKDLNSVFFTKSVAILGNYKENRKLMPKQGEEKN